MRKVNCNHCGKELFEIEERQPQGAVIYEADKRGYIPKNPFLFTNKSELLVFCSKPCQREYFDLHVPKNPEMSKALEDIKAKIPEMAADTAKAVANFASALKRIQRKK